MILTSVTAPQKLLKKFKEILTIDSGLVGCFALILRFPFVILSTCAIFWSEVEAFVNSLVYIGYDFD